MRADLPKIVLGLSVPILVLSATNVARADDPTTGHYFQLQYNKYLAYRHEYYPECVSVGGTTPNNGASVISYFCKPNTAAVDQAWFWDIDDCFTTTNETTGEQSRWCTIRNSQNTGKCMGISAGSRNEGAHAVMWDCLGKTHYDQYWLIQGDSYGYYQLWNYNNFSLGLGPVGDAYVDCYYDGPIQVCNDVDVLGLTSQLSTFSAFNAQP